MTVTKTSFEENDMTEFESIKSDAVRVLSEFDFAGDVKILERIHTVYTKYRIGLLDGNFLIAGKNENDDFEAIIAETEREGTEHGKKVIRDLQRRDWWKTLLVFQAINLDSIIERLEEIYVLKTSPETDLNELEIISGKDQIAIRINSIMPHNAGKPIISFQFVNYRSIKIDNGYETAEMQLLTTVETGEKLMTELRKAQPIVKEKDKRRTGDANYGTDN